MNLLMLVAIIGAMIINAIVQPLHVCYARLQPGE
jgi:hypothetical protein